MAEDTLADADWGLVPDHLHHELETYLVIGKLPTSRFLFSVLAYDMDAAEMVANPVEDAALPDLVHFLNTYAPGLAHGSLRKILVWEFLGGLEGRDVEEMIAS